MPMKELPLANKLRNLTPGKSFTVKTEGERQKVNRIVKALKDAGYLSHDIITRKSDSGFTVAAI